MKINYNASAMRANHALNVSDQKVSKSLQRLSSGLKVVAAKDNPAGYAIARRMNAQIEGIGVATKDSNNGISIVEIADGALTEVHDMLQRMNELAVKGETGTLTTADRKMVQAEVKQLKEEIQRISTDTEFNGQPILDGSFDLKGYTDSLDVKVDYYSDEVVAKQYTIEKLTVFYKDSGEIDLEATAATFKAGDGFPAGAKLSSVAENAVTITGIPGFELTLGITPDPVKDAEGNITGYNPVEVTQSDTTIEVTDAGYTSGAVTITKKPSVTADYRIDDLSVAFDAGGKVDLTNTKVVVNGATATLAANGDLKFTATAPDGAAFDIVVEPSAVKPGESVALASSATVLSIDVTGIGAMDVQTGANEGQQLEIRIPEMSLHRLGIENVDMSTIEGSASANVAIKGAILYVSDARSRLGAYQNRLEHTLNNLAVSNENMTASYSRIMDADVAEEMTNYTTEQVVSQAAVSMLAQANERPSQVLQLLQ